SARSPRYSVYASRDRWCLLSFPTRRSSDLLFDMNGFYGFQHALGQLYLQAREVVLQLFEVGCADDVTGHEGLLRHIGQGHLGRVEIMLACQRNVARACCSSLWVAVAGKPAE